jgi:hypothetical protein
MNALRASFCLVVLSLGFGCSKPPPQSPQQIEWNRQMNALTDRQLKESSALFERHLAELNRIIDAQNAAKGDKRKLADLDGAMARLTHKHAIEDENLRYKHEVENGNLIARMPTAPGNPPSP